MITVIAVLLMVAAIGYFLTTTLADLYPLNNTRTSTRRERRTEVAINAPIMTLPPVLLVTAAAAGRPWLGLVAAGLELLIAAGGLLLWWTPYLLGRNMPWATAGTGHSWPELHARTYASTVIILPRIGDRPRPNLEHMILHALMLAAAFAGFLAAATL